MIPKQLIHAAIAAALIAAASGKISEFIQTMRVAQYLLLNDLHASKWGRAMLLSVRE